MFIESLPNISAATRLTYSKTLTAVFRRATGDSLPISALHQAGLRAAGGLVPMHQAVPVTLEELNLLLWRALQEGPRLMAAVFLLWKTASRVDEITRLTRRSFVSSTATEIIIAWGTEHKSGKLDPFRASNWCVVEHQQSMQSVVNVVHQLEEDELLLNWTASDFQSWLNRQTTPDGSSLSHLTLHSFKRAALLHLVMMAQSGFNVELDKLPLLAKHKTLFDYSSVTLRYLSSQQRAIALMLGTQHLTRLLPCLLPGEPVPAPLTPQGAAGQEAVQRLEQQKRMQQQLEEMDSLVDDMPLAEQRAALEVLQEPVLAAMRRPTRRRAASAPARRLPTERLAAEFEGASVMERVRSKRLARAAHGVGSSTRL